VPAAAAFKETPTRADAKAATIDGRSTAGPPRGDPPTESVAGLADRRRRLYARAMGSAIARLLSIASRPLSAANASLSPSTQASAGSLAPDLLALLNARNGFFAFGPALHVFPTESSNLSWGLEDWNRSGLWKHAYASFVDPGLCFAEDVFGNQFCFKDGHVHHFQVEDGQLERIAPSLEAWAELVLSDDAFWTGWPLAQQWAEHDAPIPPRKRLHPATPFMCGGSYDLDNLRPVDAAQLMAYWGHFATQVHDLPEGATIKLTVTD
jgi:hypothetical protein